MDIAKAQAELQLLGVIDDDSSIQKAFEEKSQVLATTMVQLLAYKRVEKLIRIHNLMIQSGLNPQDSTVDFKRRPVPSLEKALAKLEIAPNSSLSLFFNSYSQHLAQHKLRLAQSSNPLETARAIEDWIYLDLCYQVLLNQSLISVFREEDLSTLEVKIAEHVWTNELLAEAENNKTSMLPMNELNKHEIKLELAPLLAKEALRCSKSIKLYKSKL